MVEVTQLFLPLFGLGLLAVGASIVRTGREHRRKADRVASTPVSDAGSVQPGPVALEGTARVDPEEGTVTTSLSGESALVSRATVTVVSDEDDNSMRRLHDERRTVPFLLADDTGTVRVVPPAEADLRLDDTVEVVHGHEVPDAAAVADDPAAAADGPVPVAVSARFMHERRRYEQGLIAAGESVYVLGEAVERADWDGVDVEVTGGADPSGFVVSDEGREAVASGGRIGAYIAYAFGGVLSLAGVLLLAVGAASLL